MTPPKPPPSEPENAAVDLARALDPLPPSFDVADLLLSLHPMDQLQNDDAAVKVTISLVEASEQWANPGRQMRGVSSGHKT